MVRRERLLGMKVNCVDRAEALKIIAGWLSARFVRIRWVITAYSEFFVKAGEDELFRKVWKDADLVVPDGIGTLIGLEYMRERNMCKAMYKGFVGKLAETVTGVFLSRKLVQMASDKGWRVFLLGGFTDTSERLASMLKDEYPKLRVEFGAGEAVVGESVAKNDRVIEKINKFGADLLLVAYGPVKQENWIFENKNRLNVKVAIGVGGTFDEWLDQSLSAPVWMERRGLKWLWRLLRQPSRAGRIWRAVVVFPLMVVKHGRKGRGVCKKIY